MASQRPLSRSEQMSRIHARNTRPERRLRSALWAAGLRYRAHAKTPAGKPDVVFPANHIAVFIDGCFWHGCPEHYVRPGSRAEFWSEKLRSNVERDRHQTLELESLGWRVIRVWEHQVYESLDEIVCGIEESIRGEVPINLPDWRVIRVEEIDHARRIERRHLEQLRAPQMTRMEEGRRITKKWRRPTK